MSDYLRNEEWSWILRPLNGFTITPSVRDQGRRPSCVFEAFSGGTEMEKKRCEALRSVPASSNLRVNTPSYVRDYEHLVGRELGDGRLNDFAPGRVWSAAHLILHHGVRASEAGQNEQRIRLDSVQAHGFLKFHKVMAFIRQGKAVIGGFTCNANLDNLRRGQIYTFRPSRRLRTIKHMVLFVGYGQRSRRTYLVFLNSAGEGFSQDGFGRIWFDEVRDFHTIQIHGQPFRSEPVLTHLMTESYTYRGGQGMRSAARRYSYAYVTAASSSSRPSVDATPRQAGDFEFIRDEYK